tara:strand:+ start:213 stop:356 length:144 start_codon:yes stop_codon:yes gene_type:complete
VQVSNVFKIKKDTLINVKLDQLLISVEEIKEDINILKKKMDKSDKEL